MPQTWAGAQPTHWAQAAYKFGAESKRMTDHCCAKALHYLHTRTVLHCNQAEAGVYPVVEVVTNLVGRAVLLRGLDELR